MGIFLFFSSLGQPSQNQKYYKSVEQFLSAKKAQPQLHFSCIPETLARVNCIKRIRANPYIALNLDVSLHPFYIS